MADKKSSQAIETFYLKDDPTVIMDSVEEATNFNTELQEEVVNKLATLAPRQTNGSKTITSMDPEERRQLLQQARSQQVTAQQPFTFEYVAERLQGSILTANDANNKTEVRRLQTLLEKLQKGELNPLQVVREAWFRSKPASS